MSSITTENLRETIDAFRRSVDGVPDTIRVALFESLQDIRGDVVTYPPEPPYAGTRNYGIRSWKPYQRTMNYANTTTPITVTQRGGEIVGYFATPADYAVYLRGETDGSYLGAWMHRPFWESLQSILERRLPEASEHMQDALQNYFDDNGLGN